MPRYKLRTLLILLAIGPPMLAIGFWAWTEYRAAQEREIARHFNGAGSRHFETFEPVRSGVHDVLYEAQTNPTLSRPAHSN